MDARVRFFPQVLPGARAVLFNVPSTPSLASLDDLSIDVFVFETGETKTLLNGGYWPRYMATSGKTGHLVYMRQGTLFGVPFDPERLEIRGTPDGSGQPQPLLDKAASPRPFSFRPDGRLVYTPSGPGGLPDIWTMPLDLSDPERPKPGKAEPFLVEPQIVEVDPAFSPDGTFLAYASNESGPNEVFVRPFPGPGGKWKISTAGGKFPAWSRTTRELFFLGGDDRIMVVSYATEGNSFSAGRPRPWSPTQVRRDGVRQNFDVSADGKRVVIFPRPAAEQAEGSLHATFLLNFFDEVRRRIP
jgi:hypothetical protein